VEKQRSQIESK